MSTNVTESFPAFNRVDAPEASRPLIDASIEAYGFLPNLHAVMAGAPALLEAYQTVFSLFESTTLSPIEQQVVFMTASYENDCHYCIPAHTYLMRHAGMAEPVIEALREGTTIPMPRLEALRVFVRQLVEQRGHLAPAAIKAFLEAGFTQRQALEVLVGLAAKTLSNYTNGLARTEIDRGLQTLAWTHPDRR